MLLLLLKPDKAVVEVCSDALFAAAGAHHAGRCAPSLAFFKGVFEPSLDKHGFFDFARIQICVFSFFLSHQFTPQRWTLSTNIGYILLNPHFTELYSFIYNWHYDLFQQPCCVYTIA